MRRVAASAAPTCARGAAAVLCQIADGVAAAALLPPRATSSALPPARGAVLQSQRSAERVSAPSTEVIAARHDDDDATRLELAAAMTVMLVLFFGVPYVLPFLPALFAWYIWRVRTQTQNAQNSCARVAHAYRDSHRTPWLNCSTLACVQTGSRVAALLLVAWCAEVAAPPRYTTWPAVTRLLRWPLWHTWRRYHRYEIIAEAPLDPHGVYIFCAHPHGVFPQAQWLTNPMGCDARALHEPRRGSADAAILSVFTMPAVRAAVSSIMLRLPGLRHVLQWAGCFPATRAAIERMLRAGTSVVLVPGGLAEAWESRSDAETLVLLQRKGFVRAALATGAALVPIYCFGARLARSGAAARLNFSFP
jgi:hypothetical protein